MIPHSRSPELKVVLLGAGSYVFGPTVLYQLFVEHRLSGVALALVDVDREMLALMHGLAQSLARTGARISAHAEAGEALDGADFVICCAAHDGLARFETDRRLVAEHAPGHLLTEFGGVAGISYALRQIALIEGVAREMRRRCPGARLLNVANPLPRVCRAAAELGVETIGLCAAADHGYEQLWGLFGHPGRLRFPFAAARQRFAMVTAGLNHLAWVVELAGRPGGRDLLAELRRRVAEGASSGNPLCESQCAETGFLLTPCDNHVRDFFAPGAASPAVAVPFHGTVKDRARRVRQLRAIVAGERAPQVLEGENAWERPVDLIAAMTTGPAVAVAAIDLPNRGQLPGLPEGAIVETPATVDETGPHPRAIDLPAALLPLARRVTELDELVTRAALQHRRALVHQAVARDPTVVETDAGIRAIDACIEAHADLLPRYE